MKLKTMFTAIVAILALAACQKPTPYMTLSDKTLQVGEDGGKVSFSISANTYYRVNNDIEWAEFVVESTVGETTTFSITVPANPKTEKRSSTVRFIGDGVTPLKFTLVQDAKTPVGVTPEKIDVAFNETSASFTVLGIKPWTASCDNSAFKLSATSGKGEAVVNVTFPENEKEQVVKAIVTVTIDAQSYTCEINQGAAPSKERIDLGANGTSNCYIVSQPGYYKFKATVAGNGVVPKSQTSISSTLAPVNAAVLWSTYNTNVAPENDNTIITGVELSDGYVVFNTADMVSIVEGNVIIAAYNSASEIIWSWQIWVTDAPKDITVGTDNWLDRNLGALEPSTYMTTNALAAGMFYQWGRKDPFRGTYTFQEPSVGDCDMATTGTWPAPEHAVSGNGSVENSIKKPQQVWHVAGSTDNNKDWISGAQYDDLWGAGAVASTKDFSAFPKTSKSMFDPCPVGYCVPTSLQFNNASTTIGLAKTDIVKANGTETPTIYGLGKESFYIVYAGGLLYDSGTIGGPVGQYSWYGTSCTNGVNQLCSRSHTTAYNWGGAGSGRSAGYSIRCVKE